MLDRLLNGYRKIRSFPKDIFSSLDSIAATVASLRQQREADLLQTSSALQVMQAELVRFHQQTTAAIVNVQAADQDRASQAADMERRLAAAEASAGDMSDAIKASRQEAAAQYAEAVSRLHAIDHRLSNADATLHDMHELLGHFDKVLASLSGTIDAQAVKIAHLGMVLAETARIYPSWMWKPEVAERVRSIMALLEPVSVPGVAKTRLGRDRDGGYVMLDDFADIAAALSLGIADDVSWDTDIASRGVKVLQFDPTVPASPASHDLFSFEKLRVAPQDTEDAVSLDTIVRTRVESPDAPLILKIDIEGDEWPVFLAASDATMRRFKQIVCEFHNLERLGEDAFGGTARVVFAKLALTHFVCHVHGNNCASFTNVGNVVVPQSLEVSFGLRSAYATAEATGPFPTELDFPNEPGRADLYLGNFRFGNGRGQAASGPARS